jgi:hypothetical protein
MAMLFRTGRPVNAETIPVTIVIPADGHLTFCEKDCFAD